MKMNTNAEDTMKEFLAQKLRLRVARNPYFSLAHSTEPPENFVLGMLVPVEIIDFEVRGRIETFTQLYMVFFE